MKRLLLLCFLSLATAGGHAQEEIMEVIPLRHQTAEQLIPVLKPLLHPDGVLTGTQDRLIVRTTAANLAEIRLALVELDRALRQLRIYVKQRAEAKVTGKETHVQGTYRSGDVGARVGDVPRSRDGADISVATDDASVRFKHLDTRGRDERSDLHHVLTVEGQPAFIKAGQSVPYVEQTTYVSPYGVHSREGIGYRDVDSGFYVLPRVHGDRVTLEIAPHQAAFSARGGGVVEQHSASTTVSGRLGEWIDLGGISEDYQDSSGAILSTTRRRGEQLRSISVLVEIVP